VTFQEKRLLRWTQKTGLAEALMSRFDSGNDQPMALVNRQGADSPEDSSKRFRKTAGFRESADGQKAVRPARLKVVVRRAGARGFPTP